MAFNHPALSTYGFTRNEIGEVVFIFKVYKNVNVDYVNNGGDHRKIILTYDSNTIDLNSTSPHTKIYTFIADKLNIEFNTTESTPGAITIRRPKVYIED